MGVCLCMYTHSNQGLYNIKKENRVHGYGKVHSWKTCTKPMGANAKNLVQTKRDNRRSMVGGEYKLVRVCMSEIITQEGVCVSTLNFFIFCFLLTYHVVKKGQIP